MVFYFFAVAFSFFQFLLIDNPEIKKASISEPICVITYLRDGEKENGERNCRYFCFFVLDVLSYSLVPSIPPFFFSFLFLGDIIIIIHPSIHPSNPLKNENVNTIS